MRAPLIAITTYPADAEAAGRVNLPPEYVDCVRRAGGRALLVPPGDTDPSGLLDAVDGLVLTGGGDIDPARWGGGEHPTVYMTDDARDDLELELARLAVEREVPTFAICRGVQVLNVALGGTLHLHVPDTFGLSVTHRLPPREPVPHRVSVESSSELARILGSTEIEPMSWHHQSIDRLGRGLRLAAVAPDGVVEAVEHESHPCLIAVQWHPELTAAIDRAQAALFETFVRAASSTTLVP
jgi:putative glutamine amidotransferase